MGVDIEGEADLFDDLDDLQDDFTGDVTWVTGSNVEYSVFLEFGTSKMDPKPVFQPAKAEVVSKGAEDFIDHNTELSVGDIDSVNELVSTLALALERRVKEIIKRKSLIDTGTYRASVVAVPLADVSQLPETSDFEAYEGNVPAGAGAALVSRNIEVNT
jgi:hypothetical protein